MFKVWDVCCSCKFFKNLRATVNHDERGFLLHREVDKCQNVPLKTTYRIKKEMNNLIFYNIVVFPSSSVEVCQRFPVRLRAGIIIWHVLVLLSSLKTMKTDFFLFLGKKSNILLSVFRLDILHQVEVWQRNFKRIVSTTGSTFCYVKVWYACLKIFTTIFKLYILSYLKCWHMIYFFCCQSVQLSAWKIQIHAAAQF